MIAMKKLDGLVASHLEDHLLDPAHLEEMLAAIFDLRQARSARRREYIAEWHKRATESDLHSVA